MNVPGYVKGALGLGAARTKLSDTSMESLQRIQSNMCDSMRYKRWGTWGQG